MFHPSGPTFWELAQQALSSTRRGYDLLAPKFDYTPFRTPAFLLDPVAPVVAEREVRAGLDLCCGTGAAIEMLRPVCRHSVVGIDFSEGMLRVAQEKTASAAGAAKLAFVKGDALRLPFREAFDVAVCFGALGHIADAEQQEFVRQVHQTLRPGGRLIFATSRLPPRVSKRFWLSLGFNAAMRLRNWVISPPFVMYYLTFLIPESVDLLQRVGFQVEVRERLFPPPFDPMCLVIATKH